MLYGPRPASADQVEHSCPELVEGTSEFIAIVVQKGSEQIDVNALDAMRNGKRLRHG